jgi:hypothetical protein
VSAADLLLDASQLRGLRTWYRQSRDAAAAAADEARAKTEAEEALKRKREALRSAPDARPRMNVTLKAVGQAVVQLTDESASCLRQGGHGRWELTCAAQWCRIASCCGFSSSWSTASPPATSAASFATAMCAAATTRRAVF